MIMMITIIIVIIIIIIIIFIIIIITPKRRKLVSNMSILVFVASNVYCSLFKRKKTLKLSQTETKPKNAVSRLQGRKHCATPVPN